MHPEKDQADPSQEPQEAVVSYTQLHPVQQRQATKGYVETQKEHRTSIKQILRHQTVEQTPLAVGGNTCFHL